MLIQIERSDYDYSDTQADSRGRKKCGSFLSNCLFDRWRVGNGAWHSEVGGTGPHPGAALYSFDRHAIFGGGVHHAWIPVSCLAKGGPTKRLHPTAARPFRSQARLGSYIVFALDLRPRRRQVRRGVPFVINQPLIGLHDAITCVMDDAYSARI